MIGREPQESDHREEKAERNFFEVSSPTSGREYADALQGPAKRLNKNEWLNIAYTYNTWPTYKKIIAQADVRRLADNDLAKYFRPEDIERAISELEKIQEGHKPNEINPYYQYCLNSFKSGLTPMSETTWSRTRNVTEMRRNLDKRAPGFNENNWEIASPQGSEGVNVEISDQLK